MNMDKGKKYEIHTAHKMRWHGFIFVKVVGQSSDYGADVIARDFLFRKTIVQCKNYSKPVGVKAVQEAFTAKKFYHARRCIVATNTTFTKNAKKLASECGVELWEGY